MQYKRRENPGERPTTEQLKASWRNASPQTKADAEHHARNFLKRRPFLVTEVYDVLSKTNGSITWRQLATQVAGGEGQVRPFSHWTVGEFMVGLPDSSYTTTRIFPSINEQSIERLYHWAKALLGLFFDCIQLESDMWLRVSTALSVLTAPSVENNDAEQTQADDDEQTQ